jgi:hypothetical protein
MSHRTRRFRIVVEVREEGEDYVIGYLLNHEFHPMVHVGHNSIVRLYGTELHLENDWAFHARALVQRFIARDANRYFDSLDQQAVGDEGEQSMRECGGENHKRSD